MNESGLSEDYFVFYRSKKFVFKKKLEDFEQKSTAFVEDQNDFLLESQWNTNLHSSLLRFVEIYQSQNHAICCVFKNL